MEELLHARADISDELTWTFEVLLRASSQSSRESSMTPGTSESDSDGDGDGGSGGEEIWEDAREALGQE